MKGIYLTVECKKRIKDEIAKLEKLKHHQYSKLKIKMYRKLLSSATILPVEESWEKLEENLFQGLHEHTQRENIIAIDYPNGVIIQANV